ncbi:peroxisomal succinyl-coenzyme A thioesterase-like isoform X3 [Brienomyrus brachyistius]|uniref:peroxisomal succinyl-coenzyme A thioesterase-like isoform X3 n=1 Tax=Brienomyrus brachyistius TaxID=42636 RepID=UPI0020B214C2|nr:peroxisomal succinyl-coenzyme A thioesterase-like isoform X3 [Brienomyrus brachyistius]
MGREALHHCAEITSRTGGDPAQPAPLRGRGPLGGFWPLCQRCHRSSPSCRGCQHGRIIHRCGAYGLIVGSEPSSREQTWSQPRASRLRKKDVCTPSVIHISVYGGHVVQGFKERKALASVNAERWYLAPGVQRVEVNEHGLTGTLFLPAGLGPFPAILDLWGGGGGLVEYRSALLAAHGYAALALQYLSQKEMPSVDNEYFETAFTFLQNHPRVCGDRVALFGLSFGTSVSLRLAAYSTVIQPRCLVCVSGSHVQPVGWSLAEIYIQFGKNVHKTRYDDQQRVIWRDLPLPIPTDASQKVDVGRIRCPVLLIVGEDDQNLPASESAEDMERMMEEAGKSHLLTKLSYPGAGHLIEPPYGPHIRASTFISLGTKALLLWGGQAQPHSHAQEDSWQKILAFLERHLYGVQMMAGL